MNPMSEDFIAKRNEMTRCALEKGSLQRFVDLYLSSDELRQAEPWVYEASAGGHLGILEFLLSQGHSPDARNSTRRKTPAICAACRSGHSEVARVLLRADASLDVSSFDDNALFSAVYGRSLECVKLLVEAGIDIHKTYDLGHRFKNALAFAEEEGCSEIATFLCEQGAVLPASKRPG